jgi:hypothetical protein
MCPIPLCNARVGLISIALFPDEAREHEGLLCTSTFQVENLEPEPAHYEGSEIRDVPEREENRK